MAEVMTIIPSSIIVVFQPLEWGSDDPGSHPGSALAWPVLPVVSWSLLGCIVRLGRLDPDLARGVV